MYSKETLWNSGILGRDPHIVEEYAKSHDLPSLKFSVSGTLFWQQPMRNSGSHKFDAPCEFDFVFGDLAGVAQKEPIGANVCIACYGDYFKPGGSFIDGLNEDREETEEEILCYSSNLYAIESSPAIFERYYAHNVKTVLDKKQGPRMMYMPEVILYSKGINRMVDVIACSMPWEDEIDINGIPSKIAAGRSSQKSSIFHRLDALLSIVESQGADTLISGSFGCEVNGCDPWIGYSIMKYFVESKYAHSFKKVIIASEGSNYLRIAKNLRENQPLIAMPGIYKG